MLVVRDGQVALHRQGGSLPWLHAAQNAAENTMQRIGQPWPQTLNQPTRKVLRIWTLKICRNGLSEDLRSRSLPWGTGAKCGFLELRMPWYAISRPRG